MGDYNKYTMEVGQQINTITSFFIYLFLAYPNLFGIKGFVVVVVVVLIFEDHSKHLSLK
jgi:hypothetical protein